MSLSAPVLAISPANSFLCRRIMNESGCNPVSESVRRGFCLFSRAQGNPNKRRVTIQTVTQAPVGEPFIYYSPHPDLDVGTKP